MVQAAGSWSFDGCCAAHGNTCDKQNNRCIDHASSSDWLFGLWPGPPQRFEPTGYDDAYQHVRADYWPDFGGKDSVLELHGLSWVQTTHTPLAIY